MKVSMTLNRYLARRFLLNLLSMIVILWGVVYLFDTVELLRRASKRGDVPLSLVLEMGLLKLPDVGQTVFPFAILFSAIYTFWQMTRRYELIVMRAAGFSVWQFLAPIVGVALAIGVFSITVVNPLGAIFLGRFAMLESHYLTHKQSHVALFEEGLWLRQAQENGYVILHAEGINLPDWQLRDVVALYFTGEDQFTRRIDSGTASLQDGMWLFKDATLNTPRSKAETVPLVALPTELTAEEIEDSFSSPETMSFWNLPSFIRTMESTGFDATRLKIHFQALLAQPFLFMAMILLAAAVTLRPPRSGGAMMLAVSGVLAGFFLFFMSSFLQALGVSHQIPVLLAAWAPAFVMLLLGGAVILNLEDG